MLHPAQCMKSVKGCTASQPFGPFADSHSTADSLVLHPGLAICLFLNWKHLSRILLDASISRPKFSSLLCQLRGPRLFPDCFTTPPVHRARLAGCERVSTVLPQLPSVGVVEFRSGKVWCVELPEQDLKCCQLLLIPMRNLYLDCNLWIKNVFTRP
jgi:hypothetical protein